jgi:hypothetical protein
MDGSHTSWRLVAVANPEIARGSEPGVSLFAFFAYTILSDDNRIVLSFIVSIIILTFIDENITAGCQLCRVIPSELPLTAVIF